MAGTARTFRVFVSSTFDDLEDERNWLQAEVFPALSRLCEANGARFQAIDLRWGVRTEASLDQKAMEICHAEIERCQRTGIKPNFIALLGDRYGWRPLPARIELNEFLNIRGQVRHADDCILVDEWYRRDDFADPPEYLLMPRTGRFTADDAWSDVEQRLHAALRQAAHQARLPRAALLRYEASATHQEILQGMGDTEASREHVFAFCRDSRKNDPEDADLRALKDVLEAQLKSNVYHYDEGDLREFGNRVDSSLRAVILREISRFKDRSVDEVERETQANVSIEHTRHFKGREQVMRAALHGAAAGDRRPTVIHGVSGSGKSALVARCAEIAAEQATGDIVVRRFVGVSPVSSSGVELLRHAYKEIARAFDIVTTDPASYDEVITAFTDAMRLATAAKPLSLFFDGVDQFRAGDPASALGWIPSELPPYCRMVVSSVGVPPALRGARLIELGALTRAEANDVLSSLLASARRKLPDELREYVLAAFGRSGLPLYLRVAMQECGRWRSFDPRESCVLGEGIDGIIDGFLDRLAEHRSHGPVLLNRALHYLAVSRYGLSEDELLDVLTNDDRVWDDFLGRAKHEPPARQLPAVIWSRLYFDLEDYLTERTVRDTAVIAINHQRSVERIAARIADESERVDTHARLANLFRKAGDPEREMSWTGPLRGMAELPHHLAQSGQQTELRELVGCIPYLDARCGGADVTDLLDDFGLVVPVDAESAVVREFIVQHAHRLAARENLLFGLIQHEGPSILRARADALVTAGRWRKPWLRTTPIPLPHEALFDW